MDEPLDSVSRPGLLRFHYAGAPRRLLGLRTASAVYAVYHFEIARPTGLLGHANLRVLDEAIKQVRQLHEAGVFGTIGISAAGANSPVMQRLREHLATTHSLSPTTGEADLLLRIRHSADGRGWEVLVRLSPRPLTTRAWRVCNLPGALNAAVAQAMMRLSEPHEQDVVLNLCCGSATLLIERAAVGPALELLGCDTSSRALACAKKNVQAAGLDRQIALHPWDARALPLPPASVDVLCADLPFGFAIGSHDENLILYPTLLREAARIARPGARFVVLTHEMRLFEACVRSMAAWRLHDQVQIHLRTLHPTIYILHRTNQVA